MENIAGPVSNHDLNEARNAVLTALNSIPGWGPEDTGNALIMIGEAVRSGRADVMRKFLDLYERRRLYGGSE